MPAETWEREEDCKIAHPPAKIAFQNLESEVPLFCVCVSFRGLTRLTQKTADEIWSM